MRRRIMVCGVLLPALTLLAGCEGCGERPPAAVVVRSAATPSPGEQAAPTPRATVRRPEATPSPSAVQADASLAAATEPSEHATGSTHRPDGSVTPSETRDQIPNPPVDGPDPATEETAPPENPESDRPAEEPLDRGGEAMAGAWDLPRQGAGTGADPAYEDEIVEEPPDSDSTPPMVVGLSFDPPQVQDGGTVRVIIETEDDISLAKSAAGSLESPTRQSFLSFAAGPVPERPGVLSGQVRVPAKAEAGWWTVSFLRVTDAAHNSQAWTSNRDPLLMTSGFEVIAETSDTALPSVAEVKVSPSEVGQEDPIQVEMQVSDEGSGIQVVRGVLSSPAGGVRVNFFPRAKGGAGRYVATVRLPACPESGEWRVSLLTVHDKAGNRLIIGWGDPLLADCKVQVSSSSEDTEPPQLSSIEFSPRRVRRTEEMHILADVFDDYCGVAAVDGWLHNQSGQGQLHFVLQSSGSPTLFEGRLSLGEYAQANHWHVQRLQITDRAGNKRVLVWQRDGELDGATVEVY